jgi:hypothetical protein
MDGTASESDQTLCSKPPSGVEISNSNPFFFHVSFLVDGFQFEYI